MATLLLLAPVAGCGPAFAQTLSVREQWATKGASGTLEFGSVDGMSEAANGSILNVVRNVRQNHSTWEVYRPDGKLVGRTRVARAYQPWGMTRNGDVLASYLDPDTDEAVAARLTLTSR